MSHTPKPEHEVQDTDTWVFFERLFREPLELDLPVIDLGFHKFQITKFMILEMIAAVLALLIFIPLARRIREGGLPKGIFWNLFESMLLFVRDEIARPNLDSEDHGDKHADHGHDAHSHAEHREGHHGSPSAASLLDHHEGDTYLPFLWTLFFFVLFSNLLGMFPMMGSPTASIWVTGGLALISFVMMHGVVIYKLGAKAYLKSLWPTIEMPPGLAFQIMGFLITFMMAIIEFMGSIIKSGVLAVRLFANMFAGHLVLATMLFFIYAVGKASGPGFLWGSVTVASVLGVVALSFLELFVAFLQAYIFTFLTALFMGMALQHAEHH